MSPGVSPGSSVDSDTTSLEAAYIGLWPCICNGAVLGLFPRLRDYTRNTVGSCLDVTAYICRSSQWEGLRFISLLGSVVKLYAFASCSYVAAIQEVQTSHSLTRRGLRAAPLRPIERAQAVVFQGSARREGVATCRELSLSQCAVLSSHHCLFIHVHAPCALRIRRDPLSRKAMEAFEDENPFESEPERLQSPDSSSSRVDISGVSSPELASQPSRLTSPPTSPSRRNTFPSSGSHRQPQAHKSDFCCARDHWLHSGEDVEILVRDFVK